MTFSEYAQGLFPFLSYGKSKPDYITELIGNFVKDAAMDACKLLGRKPDTKYRYYKGSPIQPDDAEYIYTFRDREKFSKWVWDRMDETESYDEIVKWLKKHGIESKEPAESCTDLLGNIMLSLVGATQASLMESESEIDLNLIDEIQNKIKQLPRPTNIAVPSTPTQDEKVYIEELLNAYGDAEQIDPFTENDLSSYPEYSDDLGDRRIDYYAAESIRRSVLELKSDKLTDQFDVLKDETLDGVKDTAKRSHNNGYERMLAVMEKAVVTPVTNYLLSKSPYWISGRIKKGVCHHLVNDGKLRWIRRRKNNE